MEILSYCQKLHGLDEEHGHQSFQHKGVGCTTCKAGTSLLWVSCFTPTTQSSLICYNALCFRASSAVYSCMQVRNYYDIPGSVKQILKDLDLESLNLVLLPADGSMETIRVCILSPSRVADKLAS